MVPFLRSNMAILKLPHAKSFRSWCPFINESYFFYISDFTTRWRNSGNSGWLFLGSKITTDGDYSHKIKRHLLLGRKVITNLDSIFKSRDITLPTKVCLVKAMVFPVVMYRCESWTVKKAEHRTIDAFECGIVEDSWESPGLQGDPTSPY